MFLKKTWYKRYPIKIAHCVLQWAIFACFHGQKMCQIINTLMHSCFKCIFTLRALEVWGLLHNEPISYNVLFTNRTASVNLILIAKNQLSSWCKTYRISANFYISLLRNSIHTNSAFRIFKFCAFEIVR